MKSISNLIYPYRLYFYVCRHMRIISILHFAPMIMILLLGGSASGETLYGSWTSKSVII